MISSRVLYQNILDYPSLTASSADANFPVANLTDWQPEDYFKPAAGGTINIDVTLSSPASANCLAFYNHTLVAVGGTVKVQYHNGTSYVDASAVVTPADNKPVMLFFNQQTATQWRVVITCSGVFALGVLALGNYLELPFGMYRDWSPPSLSPKDDVLNSVSESGAFLGRSVFSKGFSTTLQLNSAPEAWVRAYWKPFVTHMTEKPFFFGHNITSYPDEIAFCWSSGNLPAIPHSSFGYMSASYPIEGRVE